MVRYHPPPYNMIWVKLFSPIDEYKFHEVPRKNLDPQNGALLANLTKIYDTGKKAVNGVSMVFRKDEITCLLGRNGAGKSTIM